MRRTLLFSAIFLAGVLAQHQAGEWKNYTSLINPVDIVFSPGGNIHAATEGGILSVDTDTGNLSFLTDENGLENLDISSLAVTDNDIFLLGGNTPEGTLQIYSPAEGMIRHYLHLELTHITKIIITQDRIFASYRKGNEWGVAEFIFDDTGLPEYRDMYRNFPVTVTEIRDIAADGEFLYIVYPQGVIRGQLNEVLNFPDTWEVVFSGTDCRAIALEDDSVFVASQSGVHRIAGTGTILFIPFTEETVVEMQMIPGENRLALLTGDRYREYDMNTATLQFEFSLLPGLRFSCMALSGSQAAFGLKNHGIRLLDRSTGSFTDHIPNTLMSNRFHAITVMPDGTVLAHVSDPAGVNDEDRLAGVLILKDGVARHIIASESAETFSLDEPADNNFTAVELDWKMGGLGTGGISWTDDGYILFGNSGVFPGDPQRNGGVILIDPQSLEMSVIDTTDGVIDGQNGIVDNNSALGYMAIHRVKKDRQGNDWVVNPYSEKYNHPAAIRLTDGSWGHVEAPDEESYLPQSVTFDGRDRAWFGFRKYYGFSTGGVKVVNPLRTLTDETDDIWYPVSFTDSPPGNNVWDLTFDGLGFLWILTGGGIQGYQVYDMGAAFTLSPIFPTDYYTYLPLQKGDKIITDGQNNKWIITRHSGVKVILENTSLWPDDEGFTHHNSGLLSDVVYDAAVDEERGIIYFATDKGISALKMNVTGPVSAKADPPRFSPNPFIPSRSEVVIIEGCIPGSDIFIMTLDGHVVRKLMAEYSDLPSSQARWDGMKDNGRPAPTGIYLVAVYHPDGGKAVGKLALIRE